MAHTIAPDVDRLPWLTDDPTSKKKPGSRRWLLVSLTIMGMVTVAAAAFWVGMTQTQRAVEIESTVAQGETTTPLPEASPVQPALPSVEPVPMPQVEPAPAPAPVTIRQQQDVRPALNSAPSPRRIVKRSRPSKAKATPAPTETAEERKSLQFANPWESSGASGRMVRVGTYASLRQGKLAWSRLARLYPGMKKLPAVVTDIPSKRDGRVYYRLQIGTTSQAHSEVLCQRMKAIGQSCVVVDLAGARKGSGDERQPIGI